MSRELEKLASEDVESAVMGLSNVTARVGALADTEAVQEVRNAIRSGVVQEDDVREFVAQSLQHLRLGERFRFETSLAGLAVAVCDYFDEWAEEYLERLAQLQHPELAYASAVARVCLERRKTYSLQDTRFETFESEREYEQFGFTSTDGNWDDEAQSNTERFEYA